MQRRLLALLTAAGVLTIVGTFLPWLRSGARWRTSYDLLGLVGRLEIARGRGASLLHWWPLVPLLITAVVICGWWGARRVAVALSISSMATVLHVAVVIRRAGPRVGMHVGLGPLWTAIAVIVLAACCVWLATSPGTRSGAVPAESVPSEHADA